MRTENEIKDKLKEYEENIKFLETFSKKKDDYPRAKKRINYFKMGFRRN
jgi:hypothetical protein|nr:MAG TPA: hypothetical protein [Caudoviricetes sp.]